MPQRIEGNRTLISTSEACEIAGVTSAYIQRLLRNERIEGVKLGRDWLIYEDSLKAFIVHPRKRGRPHKEAAQDPLIESSSPIDGQARSASYEEGKKAKGDQQA